MHTCTLVCIRMRICVHVHAFSHAVINVCTLSRALLCAKSLTVRMHACVHVGIRCRRADTGTPTQHPLTLARSVSRCISWSCSPAHLGVGSRGRSRIILPRQRPNHTVATCTATTTASNSSATRHIQRQMRLALFRCIALRACVCVCVRVSVRVCAYSLGMRACQSCSRSCSLWHIHRSLSTNTLTFIFEANSSISISFFLSLFHFLAFPSFLSPLLCLSLSLCPSLACSPFAISAVHTHTHTPVALPRGLEYNGPAKPLAWRDLIILHTRTHTCISTHSPHTRTHTQTYTHTCISTPSASDWATPHFVRTYTRSTNSLYTRTHTHIHICISTPWASYLATPHFVRMYTLSTHSPHTHIHTHTHLSAHSQQATGQHPTSCVYMHTNTHNHKHTPKKHTHTFRYQEGTTVQDPQAPRAAEQETN